MTGLINDKRWYKLFKILLDNIITVVSVKYLLNDRIYELYLGKGWFTENGFKDNNVGGPFLYKGHSVIPNAIQRIPHTAF
jgi:hypothetical protein